MIQIPRSLARSFRAILRKSVLPMAARSLPPPVVFRADAAGLFVESHCSSVAVRHHVAGDQPSQVLALPSASLDDFEGRDDGPVTLEMTEEGKIAAHWQDGAVPQVRQYEPSQQIPTFPDLPEKFEPQPSGFLGAFHEAAATCSQSSGSRYALQSVLLRGDTGQVAGTDGRHLFIQGGFSFPWDSQLLVPGLSVFGIRDLLQEESVSVGRTEDQVAVQVGSWTFCLSIDKEGRFPATDTIIPDSRKAVAGLRVSPEDAAFLLATLPRLPGQEEDSAPITMECNGHFVVRAKGEEQKQPTEVILAGSQATGKAVSIATNRNYLLRALRLGATEFCLYGSNSAVLTKNGARIYLWMPLSQGTIIGPSKDAIRISSGQNGQFTEQAPKERSKPTMTTPKAPSNDDAKPAAPTANGSGINALIAETESLKDLLRDAYGRATQLVAAVKRQKKQAQVVQSTLAALKELQPIEG